MKIALLEPIGVPGEIIKAFGDKLQEWAMNLSVMIQ